MAKIVLKLFKIIMFILIFIILFVLFTEILRYKPTEKLRDSKKQLIKMSKDSIDVFFLGGSAVYADISPINLWDKFGITSFNLSSSTQPPILTYYTLLESVKYHKPKIIVIDFSSLTYDNNPEENEPYYLRALDGILDIRLKYKAVEAIKKEYNIPSTISYLLPFYRYHSRWSELEKNDFIENNSYKAYTLGGLLNNKVRKVNFSKNFMDTSIEIKKPQLNTFSVEYYEKIIKYAKDSGIKIFAISPPKLDTSYAKHLVFKEFCENNQIEYLDFNLLENLERLNLNFEEDFYDLKHLNVYGNKKFTLNLGEHLVENYSLKDKKKDKLYNYWNDLYKEYQETL